MENDSIEALLNQPAASPTPPLPPQPAEMPPSSGPEQSAPPSLGNKKSLLIGSVALAVLLAGGGALAYFFYPPAPAKVVAQMMNSLPQVTSVEYLLKLDFDISGNFTDVIPPAQTMQFLTPEANDERQVKFTVEIEGKSDTTDLDNPKSAAHIKLSGEGLVLAGEVISIGSTAYFKLTEAPLLGFLDTGEIKNQWFKFDSERFQRESGVRANQPELTEADKQKIMEAFSKYQIVKVVEKLESEQIEGMGTHHYRISVDKTQLINFSREVSTIIGETLTDQELEEVAKAFDSLDLTNAEVWIGKKDNLPYRLSLAVDFKSMENSDTQGHMTLDATMKNYNKPVTIEAPRPVKDLNELFNSAFSLPAQPLIPPDPELPGDLNFELPPDFGSDFDFGTN